MNQLPPERFNMGGAVDLTPLVQRSMQTASGQRAPEPTTDTGGGAAPQVVDVPSLVIDVTDDTFQQIAQLSMVVPIVVDLWAEWCQPCKTLGPILEKVTADLGGKILLVKVDVDSNPQLTQAFQAQSIPTVAAIVAGKPISLFQGAIPEQQVIEVFTQLLEIAQQQGVTGRVNAPEGAQVTQEPEMSPLQQEAFDAIERGDYQAAMAAYEQAIVENPRDTEAQAGLSQVRLLARLQGKSLDEIRSKASAEPNNLQAQLDVADVDLSGGHVEDAFGRLLDYFAQADDDEKQIIRERLLELFDTIGLTDPRVLAARTRLASLLY